MNNNYFKHFIYTTQAFTPQQCEYQIQRFEEDTTHQTDDYEINKNMRWKNYTSIYISKHHHWNDIDELYAETTGRLLKEYAHHCERVLDDCEPRPVIFNNVTYNDTGFKIKRYDPGDYFHWHHDLTNTDKQGLRQIGCIFYLNDVVEGGQTEFLDGTIITPTQGTVLMFPSAWTYVHRGLPPVNQRKYATTTFICSRETSS